MSLAHWKQYESENLQVDVYFYQQAIVRHTGNNYFIEHTTDYVRST